MKSRKKLYIMLWAGGDEVVKNEDGTIMLFDSEYEARHSISYPVGSIILDISEGS